MLRGLRLVLYPEFPFSLLQNGQDQPLGSVAVKAEMMGQNPGMGWHSGGLTELHLRPLLLCKESECSAPRPLGTLCHTVQGLGQVICPFYALWPQGRPLRGAHLWGWRWEDKHWPTITQ